MLHRLCLLLNPKAGKGNAQRFLLPVVTMLSKAGWVVTVMPDVTASEQAAWAYAHLKDFEWVICCGGDGTLHHTVHRFMAEIEAPLLGYLPMGSTNDFASMMGYPNGMENCVAALLDGKSAPVDVGLFCGEQHFCYVAAFGAFTKVSYSTPQELKNAIGHAAYLIEGVRNLPINEDQHAVITADGVCIEGDFIYGAVTNSNKVGGFRCPSPHAPFLDDGLFEVLLIKAPKNSGELSSLAMALLGGNTEGNDLIYSFQAKKVYFSFQMPTSFTLDGEFGGTVEEATVEILPGAIGMRLPQAAPLQGKVAAALPLRFEAEKN